MNRANQKNKTPGRETLLEFFANAERRAGPGRYDDAVGRLYRAVELREQLRLREPNRAGGGRYELGLHRLFQALPCRDAAEIRPQSASYAAIARQLQNRNNSLRAHGVMPVAPDDYAALRQDVLRGCAVADADRPRWPALTRRLP